MGYLWAPVCTAKWAEGGRERVENGSENKKKEKEKVGERQRGKGRRICRVLNLRRRMGRG